MEETSLSGNLTYSILHTQFRSSGTIYHLPKIRNKNQKTQINLQKTLQLKK